jgi:pantoate kinase
MTGSRSVGTSRSAVETLGTAFVPGHVTGVFAPRLGARDPRGRGSIGAGLVLELGARASARWRPGPDRSIVVRSPERMPLPISRDVAERIKGERPGRLVVDLVHQLPVGQGFGMSAAGALATGHAVALAVGHDPADVPEVAHLAELLGGGGLGGVSAVLGGGLEVRRAPGIPPFGTIERWPFRPSVVLGVFGPPLPSPALLRDASFLDRVDRAAADELRALGPRPTPLAFLTAAERFSDRLDLAPGSLRRQILRLRATGAKVAQTMFGRSFFAVAMDARTRGRLLEALSRTRVRAVEVSVVPPSHETL